MTKKKRTESRDQVFAKIHEYLIDTRTRLMREIAARRGTERNAARDECMDSCDLASEENERELSTMLSEREQLKVAQIDDALRRIASLKYGLCEICELGISAERLKAMPFSRLCCDCQQELEREVKARRRYGERDYEGYKLGSLDAEDEDNRNLPMSLGN